MDGRSCMLCLGKVCSGSVLRPLITVDGESTSDLFCNQSIPDRLCGQRCRHIAANAVLPAHDFAEPPHSPVIFTGAPWGEARNLERAAVHGGFRE